MVHSTRWWPFCFPRITTPDNHGGPNGRVNPNYDGPLRDLRHLLRADQHCSIIHASSTQLRVASERSRTVEDPLAEEAEAGSAEAHTFEELDACDVAFDLAVSAAVTASWSQRRPL